MRDYQKLSVAERILLVEEIWDSIATEHEAKSPQLLESQRQELERRLDEYTKGKADKQSWQDVKHRLLSSL